MKIRLWFYLEIIFTLLNFVLIVVPVLVNVAFITLLERKILGYSQLRKGPNKVRIGGVAQPFNDAIKLFSKEIVIPNLSNIFKYLIAPVLGLFIVLVGFMTIPFLENSFSISISVMLIYTLLRVNIYPLIISGWASNRKYALVGSLRAIAQTVSYEVSLAIIIIFYTSLSYSLGLSGITVINNYWNKILVFMPMAMIWLISCVAETNRTPFDFAEGESELVSGFNIEYGSVGFAIIFMAEYARIFFISMIFSFIFLSDNTKSIIPYVFSCLLVSIWIWARATFPRYRYDKLIDLAWKKYLPVVLISVIYSVFLILT